MTLCLAIRGLAHNSAHVYLSAVLAPPTSTCVHCAAAACSAMAGNGRTNLSELIAAHRGITSDKITERKVMPWLAREEGVGATVGDKCGAH